MYQVKLDSTCQSAVLAQNIRHLGYFCVILITILFANLENKGLSTYRLFHCTLQSRHFCPETYRVTKIVNIYLILKFGNFI